MGKLRSISLVFMSRLVHTTSRIGVNTSRILSHPATNVGNEFSNEKFCQLLKIVKLIGESAPSHSWGGLLTNDTTYSNVSLQRQRQKGYLRDMILPESGHQSNIHKFYTTSLRRCESIGRPLYNLQIFSTCGASRPSTLAFQIHITHQLHSLRCAVILRP